MSTQKETIRCLAVFYIFCAIFVCLLIVYIQRQPHYIELVNLPHENADQLFNLNDFKYVLNSGSCNSSTFVIFIVTSYAGDFETRSAVRQAYPKSLLDKLNLKRVFLLALIDEYKNFNKVEQAAIENEQERYGDLVQGNFIEDYRNLTYKHVMGLKWVTEHCENARFVIKMDHDIIFNLFSLVQFLRKLPARDRMLAGYEMYNMKPLRDPASKWFVTRKEFAFDSYPNFLSGWLYITNPYTVKLLYKTSKSVPYFWIDDTYVTGIVAEKLKLEFAGLNKYYTTETARLKCCVKGAPLIHCPYWVGPNGGEAKLIIEFAKHSEVCFKSKCASANVSSCKAHDKKGDSVVHIL